MPITTRTVRAYALGLITGTLFTSAGIMAAPHAQAQPDSTSAAYAEQYGQAICNTLDDYPSFDGIIGIATVIMDEDGLTPRQAGHAMALSVVDLCPWHLDLLDRFATRYGGKDTLA